MTSRNFWNNRRLPAIAALLWTLSPLSYGQTDALSVATPAKQTVQRGGIATIALPVKLKPGYHVNSNTPSEEYLIPLRLTWDAKPLEVDSVQFPVAKVEKYDFSEKPLSVYVADFEIQSRLKVPASAAPGLAMAAAKLRYQACSKTMCLPPKTLSVTVPLEIR